MSQTIKTLAQVSDETRIRLLLPRLVSQYGTQAVRIANNLVRGWKLRHPVEREPVHTSAILDFEDISFVEVASEKCVRIGVGPRLITASGENAKKLLTWARGCGSLKGRDHQIPRIPDDIQFDRSVFDVCVQDGELAFA